MKENQNTENMTNAGEKCKLAPRNALPLTVCLRVTLWELITLSEALDDSLSFQQSTPKHKDGLFNVQ